MTDLRPFIASELTRLRDRAPAIIAAGGEGARLAELSMPIWEDIAQYFGVTESGDDTDHYFDEIRLAAMASESHRAWTVARDRERTSWTDSSIQFNIPRARGLMALSQSLTSTAKALSSANQRGRTMGEKAREEMVA